MDDSSRPILDYAHPNSKRAPRICLIMAVACVTCSLLEAGSTLVIAAKAGGYTPQYRQYLQTANAAAATPPAGSYYISPKFQGSMYARRSMFEFRGTYVAIVLATLGGVFLIIGVFRPRIQQRTAQAN